MKNLTDARDGRLAEALLAGDRQLLEMIARGESLLFILESLCRLVESVSEGALCSVLLLDAGGGRLWPGAGPSLPKGYTDAISGASIGPNAGSCGSAAYRKELVVVSDIMTDPLWAQWRDLASTHGLRACWSNPILAADGAVLGTFAIYFRQPRSPTAEEKGIVEQFAHLASIAICRARRQEESRRQEAYLAEAQQLSHTGSFGWNVGTGEIVWSAETYRITGFDLTTIPTQRLIFDRIHPEDLPRVRETVARASRDGTDLDFEHRFQMPDGAVKHVHVVARAVRDELNRLEFIGAIMDITGQKRIERDLRASERLARGQVEALTRTLDVMSMESNPDRLIEHALRSLTAQFGAHSSSVWLKDEARGVMIFEWALEDDKLKARGDAVVGSISPSAPIDAYWPWPEVMRTGKPQVLEDMRQGPDVPWRPHLLAQGIITILIVPLLMAGKVVGVVGIRFTCRRGFRPEEMDLAQALANQAMLGIQLTRLSAHSRDAAVMAERNRLARDIHDTLAQGFTGVIVQLEAAEDAFSRGLEAEGASHLVRAGEMARYGLTEARNSVRALRPRVLEEKDLCAAMEELIQRMTAGTALRAEFVAPEKCRALPPEWEENLVRIGQEVLTNTLRHARASRFNAGIRYDDAKISLDMSDNGTGFDPDGKVDGFGLIGMRERVESMGGRLSIQTAPGAGTLTSITLPFPRSATPAHA